MNNSINLSDFLKPSKTGLKVLGWDFFAENADKNTWVTILNSIDLVIQFDAETFLALDGLVWLCTICHWRSKNGKNTYIILEDNQRRAAQISKYGFPKLQDSLNFQILSPNEMTETPRTRSPSEIQVFDSQKSIKISSQAYVDFGNSFRKLFGYVSLSDEFISTVTPFMVSITEHLSNVGRHSEKIEDTGIGICAYSMPKEKYPYFVFCCTDVGQGIYSSIHGKNGTSPIDHKDAIVKAILHRKLFPKEGVVGLFATLTFLHKRYGKLDIRTGDILATIDFSEGKVAERYRQIYQTGSNNPTQEWLVSLMQFKDVFEFSGTQIRLTLTAKK